MSPDQSEQLVETTPEEDLEDAIHGLISECITLENLQEKFPDLESRILWTVNDMKNLQRILEQRLIDVRI